MNKVKKVQARKSPLNDDEIRMSNTSFLIFLKNELFSAGLRWNILEELFNLIMDNNIPFKSEKKDYSKSFGRGKKGWLNPVTQGVINDDAFINQMIKTFHLYEGEHFNTDILVYKLKDKQVSLIKKGVGLYIEEKEKLENKKEKEDEVRIRDMILNNFDISTLNIHDEITEEEKSETIKIGGMSKEEIKKYFHENRNLSQKFILKVIPKIYRNGYYQILLEDWIDSLQQNYRQLIDIRKIEAHALGSKEVGKYKESFNLLKDLGTLENIEELIDLRTSAISNIRRYKLQDCTTLEELKEHLLVLKEHYEKIFNANENNHYYPGINLAYILAIGQIVFPKDEDFNFDISIIRDKTIKSIEIDNKSDNLLDVYYAKMSKCEFGMLTNNDLFERELGNLLEYEVQEVEVSDISRTLRQIDWFIDIVRRFTINTQNKIYKKSEIALKLLNDYLKYERF